jgi:hypothetical protein
MRRPRGKPKVPAKVQAKEVIAYAQSIAKARALVQRKAREAVGLKPYGLAKRTTIAAQTLIDQEADEIGCTFLFRLAAVGRVTCGSFVRFARDIEKAAEKLR